MWSHGISKLGSVTNSTIFFRPKRTRSVFGVSSTVQYRSEGKAHFICQREEIVVEPESIHSRKKVLDLAPSTTHSNCTYAYLAYQSRSRTNQFAGQEKGWVTHEAFPATIIMSMSWVDTIAERSTGDFSNF